MRRIILWLATTATVLTLLLTYHTSLSSGLSSATAASAPAVPNTTGTTGSTTDSASSTGAASTTDGTYTGNSVNTRWGAVKVQITITDGKISEVTAVDYPHGNSKDKQINSYALPKLRSEVLSAQSANIDTVSGATVTSNGYIDSLQSALDQVKK